MRRLLPLLLLTGCVGAPPQRQPLSAPVSQSTAKYPGLSAAWMPGPNVEPAKAYIAKWNAIMFGPFAAHMETERAVQEIERVMRQTFGKAVRVSSFDRSAGFDAFVLFDSYVANLPQNIFARTEISNTVSVTAADGSAVDEVKTNTSAKVTANTSFGYAPTRVRRSTELVLAQAADEVAAALAASPRLAELASGRRKSAPAASVQAAPTVTSAVDVPGYKRGEDTDAFAVVIGVEDYQSLPKADYAERDAAAVHAHLLALGYPERNVAYLTGPRAGKAALEKYIESWLPERVTDSSKVFVFFSGHGAPDIKSASAYLMPWDGDAKFADSTGYPVKRLYEKLNGLKARRIVVAMDSCFSGAGGRSVIPKGTRPLVGKLKDEDAGRVVVMTASAGDEISGGADSEGHGLFTYHLLDALQQLKGRATVSELYGALKTKVQDAARRDHRDQTPQLLGSNTGGEL